MGKGIEPAIGLDASGCLSDMACNVLTVAGDKMSDKKTAVQKIWGFALLIVGVSMFFAIPQRISDIKEAGGYSQGTIVFLTISFYIISVLLVVGGSKKLYEYVIKKKDSPDN